MPIGSFSFNPFQLPLTALPAQVGVFLYDPAADVTQEEFTFTYIPNILCNEVQLKEGADPPTARFSYIMDQRAAIAGFPTNFETIWPLVNPWAFVTPYIVTAGDRIAVVAITQDGSVFVIFDGFPRLPSVQVDPSAQMVSFTAIGAVVRAYDNPIGGRTQRGADNWMATLTGDQHLTNLPTIFNPSDTKYPAGIGNCTADGFDTLQATPNAAYPVFCEPLADISWIPGLTAAPRTSYWTLGKAVRYILSNHNRGQRFVTNPDFTGLDDLLSSLVPNGNQPVNLQDPTTYTLSPIIIRTFDATNHAWPDAIERLLGYHGFGMRWVLNSSYNPRQITSSLRTVNQLQIYRKDAANPTAPKQVWLPPYGSSINPAFVNLGSMNAGFDYHSVANAFIIETAQTRYEVSVILAPDFTPDPGDNTLPRKNDFFAANLPNLSRADQNAYRRYIADECGDGHWDFDAAAIVTNPFNFSAVWPQIQLFRGGLIDGYVVRYRPGIHRILSINGNLTSDKLRAKLSFSRDYTTAGAAALNVIWDGTGNWQDIERGWELLDDRLGIYFNCDHPDKIPCGVYKGPNRQETSGELKGLKSIAAPTMAQSEKLFYLRLTTVIEGDFGLELFTGARRRAASPMRNPIIRRIDAKEHWGYDAVHKSSEFFQATLTYMQGQFAPNPVPQEANGSIIMRDDTKAVKTYASQLRSAHERPSLPAAITVPQFTAAYALGDRISGIAGRECSFQTNVATASGETPEYPFVVGVNFLFDDGQKTTLQLSDRRTEPQAPSATKFGPSWWKGKQ